MRTCIAFVLLLTASGGCIESNEAPRPPAIALPDVDQSQDLVVEILREARDDQDDDVSYRYRWTRDGTREAQLKDARVPASFTARGEVWEVAVTATDGQNTADPVVANATIVNALPTVEAQVSPEAPETDQALTASGTPTDVDDDPVTLSYAWRVNGKETGLTTPTLEATRTAHGERWEVFITPHDGIDAGLPGTASVVIGNQPPSLETVTLDPALPGTEDPIEALAITRDGDGDTVTVSWAWAVDGAVVQEGSGPVLDPIHTQRGSLVQAFGTPHDGQLEGEALASELVEVVNTAPSVTRILLSASTVTQDDLLSVVEIDVADPDGDEVSVAYAWRADDIPVGSGDSLVVEGLWAGALIILEATAHDGLTEAAPFPSDGVTVENTAPRVSGATIQPFTAYAHDTLWVALEIDDPDEDPLSMVYTWSVDGDEVQTGPDSTLVDRFERDQEVTVTIDIEDGVHPVITRTASRYILNAPPHIEAATLSSTSLRAGDVLACSPEGLSDPDGDPVTATRDWYVNDFRVGDTEFLTDSVFRRGDEVWCTLTPSDGTTAGDPAESEHLVVENTPPESVDAVILYEQLRQGADGLQCAWEGPFPTDPEGDLVGIRAFWTVDGVTFVGESTDMPGDTILAQDTSLGETWSCVLESYDIGYEDTATGAADEVRMEPVGGNVLILLADDIGNDMIGVYAEHPNPPPTPRIDQLAAEGLMFRNAYTQPVCSPTRAALLTGRHGRRYGVGVIIDRGEYEPPVPISERMLPEVLTQSSFFSYTSSLTGKWHLSSAILGTEHPGLAGFDWYAGSPENLSYRSEIDDGIPKTYEHWVKNTNGELSNVDTYATTDTVNDALNRIDAMPEPWLLYVSFNAAHSPVHIPPAGLFTEPLIEEDEDDVKFRGVVEALDTEIGRLMDGIPTDVRARTTVVFMGDNGTPDWAITAPREAPQHKGSVYEGGTNVPMIVTSPLIPSTGETTDALIHVVDVFATVTALAGIDAHSLTRPDLLGGPDQEIVTDGISFLPYLVDPHQPSIRQTVYTERFLENGEGPYLEDRRALRDDRWKLIRTRNLGEDSVELFFDLDGVDVEGEDLLSSDTPLAGEALEAYDALSAEFEIISESLVYDIPALPPMILGVHLSPAPPTTTDDVTCGYDFLGDPNHDPITLEVEWTVNDVPLFGFVDTLLPAGIAGSGDTLTCTLTPREEFLVGESMSASETVL
jgi:arylsulfatase A-like enzyme